MSRRFYWPLRAKLALICLLLLLIPVMGGILVQQIEQNLQEKYRSELLVSAQILASSIGQSETMLQDFRQPRRVEDFDQIYVNPLRHQIVVDGYDDEWFPYVGYRKTYRAKSSTNPNSPRSSERQFSVVTGLAANRLYLFIDVQDSEVVYRTNQEVLSYSDRVILRIPTGGDSPLALLIAPLAPGKVAVSSYGAANIGPLAEQGIEAWWSEDTEGYNVEVRLPSYLYPDALSIEVDNAELIEGEPVITGSIYSSHRGFNQLLLPTQSLSSYLEPMQLPEGRRVWIVDNLGVVKASTGSLSVSYRAAQGESLIDWLLSASPENFRDPRRNATKLEAQALKAALGGAGSTDVELFKDSNTQIIMAATPVLSGGAVVGAVVVEETTAAIQLLQRKTTANLLATSLLVILFVTGILLWMATRLTRRLRALRDSAEQAIDQDGRRVDIMLASEASDEIGDLSRSFASVTKRLNDYNDYLARLAGRLAHEIRTPVAVVNASLDNLEHENLSEEGVRILATAQSGSRRLGNLLNRISEANRLEQTIHQAEFANVDLVALLSQYLDGYQSTWPDQKFHLDTDVEEYRLRVAPDLIVQMLDKLIANAVDFSDQVMPVTVELDTQHEVRLSVQNSGPRLPKARAELFDSMTSFRGHQGDTPHLGLGLYVVKMIADLHRAEISASNVDDPEGVLITVNFGPPD